MLRGLKKTSEQEKGELVKEKGAEKAGQITVTDLHCINYCKGAAILLGCPSQIKTKCLCLK